MELEADWRDARAVDALTYWTYRLSIAEAAGALSSARVCCASCDVRVGFRTDGSPQPAVVPLLPCTSPPDVAGEIGGGSWRACEQRAQYVHALFESGCARNPEQQHGSILFSLPADFLCTQHQVELCNLAHTNCASTAQWDEWARRLQLNVRDTEGSLEVAVRAEAVRLRRREDAMAFAQEGDIAFGQFCQLLALEDLEHMRVQRNMCERQHLAAAQPWFYHERAGC